MSSAQINPDDWPQPSNVVNRTVTPDGTVLGKGESMPSPQTVNEFLDLTQRSNLVDQGRLSAYIESLRASSSLPPEPVATAELLVRDGLLTRFQAEQLLQGKWKRFTIGKYKVLERLGAGGMGSVYLCEHIMMRRRVAVKVLPTAKAEDPAALERFYREARAVAALDHPNIVRAYDIDQDEKLHFLVMEHVDGSSLQDIVKKHGPLEVLRAAHYVSQAALGLQHAHEAAGLIHRDIKPGNILVDRSGIVKVLDMGLARFFHDEDDVLTRKYEENVLGTADYLAPEQALDSHLVDIRADVYSLGATFYYCLTGRTPFAEGTVAQKLIWHQTRQPKSIKTIRADVPDEMIAIITKMMAKDPQQRYQFPIEVCQALVAWTQTPIPPPPESEMPQHSLAVQTTGMAAPTGDAAAVLRTSGQLSPTPKKAWQYSSGATPIPGPLQTPTPVVPPPAAPVTARTIPAPPPERIQPAPRPPVAVPPTPPRQQPPPTEARNGKVLPPREVEVGTDAVRVGSSGDTPPRGLHETTPSSIGARGRRISATSHPQSRTIWTVGLIAGVGSAIGLAIVIWLMNRGESDTPDPPDRQSQTFFVDPSGANNALKTVNDALQLAKNGDRIVLRGTIRESVTLANRSISLEADEGETVIWKAPNKFPENTQLPTLLTIQNVEGCHIRGIQFDGENKAAALIHVYGNCAGLTLEELQLKGYKQFGLYITNVQGSPGDPVKIHDISLATPPKNARGIHFMNSEKVIRLRNRYFELANIKLLGRNRSEIKEQSFDGAVPELWSFPK